MHSRFAARDGDVYLNRFRAKAAAAFTCSERQSRSEPSAEVIDNGDYAIKVMTTDQRLQLGRMR